MSEHTTMTTTIGLINTQQNTTIVLKLLNSSLNFPCLFLISHYIDGAKTGIHMGRIVSPACIVHSVRITLGPEIHPINTGNTQGRVTAFLLTVVSSEEQLFVSLAT